MKRSQLGSIILLMAGLSSCTVTKKFADLPLQNQGESPKMTFCIRAKDYLTRLPVTLTAGKRYYFTAESVASAPLKDLWIRQTPDGKAGSCFPPPRLLRTKSVEGQQVRYFTLLGMIDERPETLFIIGSQREMIARHSGKLSCYFNDADCGFAYGNNKGHVRLSIEEKANQHPSVAVK